MKHLSIYLFLAYLSITFAIAQNDKEAAKSTVEQYFKDIHEKGMKASLDYVHPKLFTLMPRETIEKSMDEMLKDSSIRITMSDLNVKDISKTLLIKKVKYVLVKYTYKMSITVSGGIPEPDPEDLENELKKKGAEDIKVESTPNKTNMDIDAAMFVIYDKQYKGWKIIEKKENTQKFFETFLSKKEIDKLYQLE